MSQSGLTKYQDELLEILAEECAETIQEKAKIFRFGFHEASHHAVGKTHAECLTSEIGDILAMCQLVQESDMGITAEGVEQAKQAKLEKVVKWMTHQKPELESTDAPKGPASTAEVMRQTLNLAIHQLNNHSRIKP